MRPMILAAGLALSMFVTAAHAGKADNKWRLQVSGGAESAGQIVLQLAPTEGEPILVTTEVADGYGENQVARDVSKALKAAAGKHYKVEIDDGEDVLIKKRGGEPDFEVTVTENTVKGVRISLDAE